MDAAIPSRVAGLDWASRLHAVCVLDPDGQVRARFEVPHTGSELRGLTRRLVRLGVGQVAIERPDGPVVEALLAAGLEVVVIPGRQVKALRGRYGTAGNKDDRFDAYVLADALRTDGHRLAPLRPDAPQTTALRVVSQALQVAGGHPGGTRQRAPGQPRDQLPRRGDAVQRRRQPHRAGLSSPLPLGDPGGLADRSPPRRIPAPHGLSGAQGRSRAAPTSGRRPSRADRSRGEARATVTLGLVAALDTVRAQIDEFEGEVVERLGTHPDAAIFTALPRSGRVRAAALLAEIGDCRARFPDAESLTSLAGAAPSTRQSGKHKKVVFRFACDKKLRAAVMDFAGDSRHDNPGQPISISRPEPVAIATPTPSASWPGPGSE